MSGKEQGACGPFCRSCERCTAVHANPRAASQVRQSATVAIPICSCRQYILCTHSSYNARAIWASAPPGPALLAPPVPPVVRGLVCDPVPHEVTPGTWRIKKRTRFDRWKSLSPRGTLSVRSGALSQGEGQPGGGPSVNGLRSPPAHVLPFPPFQHLPSAPRRSGRSDTGR